MITDNMHEAKSNLSKLVKAIEESGEVVVLCRNGREVAEIRRRSPGKRIPRLNPDPALKVTFSAGYDPAEPAGEADWPEEFR
jgi:antitoxin (DNA-binding transcriptional repressor) of toxin-antitoxin stability system